MAHINLYFILLDPKRAPQRIISGSLGKEAWDWTMAELMSDKDDWARTYTQISDKVAFTLIDEEYAFNSYNSTILGDGWVELVVEATTMAEALTLAQEVAHTV